MHDEHVLKIFGQFGMCFAHNTSAQQRTHSTAVQCAYSANLSSHLIFIYRKQAKNKTKSIIVNWHAFAQIVLALIGLNRWYLLRNEQCNTLFDNQHVCIVSAHINNPLPFPRVIQQMFATFPNEIELSNHHSTDVKNYVMPNEKKPIKCGVHFRCC